MTMHRPIVAACVVAACVAAGCRDKIERIEWPQMGTVAAVQTRGASVDESRRITAAVRNRFEKIEKLLNARDPDSELRRLAKLSDGEIISNCNPTVRSCYEAAFAFAAESSMRFNPRWRGHGTLDLGAIAKGFAVDSAAADAAKLTDGDVLIDLGGNLKAVRGDWKTSIAGTREVFTLHEGTACATSAEYYRGRHIRDGRTGRPISAGGVLSATAVSSSAMWADAASTLAFITGPDQCAEIITRRIDGAVIWIMQDGRRIKKDAGL